MDKSRLIKLAACYKDGLLNDTLPFWAAHNPDREHGAFFNFLDRDGSIFCTDKPVWVLCRYTWLMALMYNNVERRPEWLAAARSGLDFIRRHAFDTDGRMFFLLTSDGRPLRKRRYLFTETFGVIALAEMALATDSDELRNAARRLYELILCYHQHPGLLPPKVYPQTHSAKAHAMAMILIATTQQLRKTGDDPLYERTIDQAIYEVTHHFMHEDEQVLLETVGPQGERLDGPEGRCVCPGHAIETAWFMLAEAQRRGRDRELIAKACLIIDWSLARGWDEQYGGLLYFTDVENKPCVQYEHDLKLWWPHNEAIYACLLAYHLTSDEKYARWFEKLHEYSFSHFPDPEYGEWFKYLHRDGSVSQTCKGNQWAGPFHLPRMQYNCWRLCEEMSSQSGLNEKSTLPDRRR